MIFLSVLHQMRVTPTINSLLTILSVVFELFNVSTGINIVILVYNAIVRDYLIGSRAILCEITCFRALVSVIVIFVIMAGMDFKFMPSARMNIFLWGCN